MPEPSMPPRGKTLDQYLAEHIVGPPELKPTRATEHCRHYGYRSTGLAGFARGDHGGPTCAAGCDNRTAPGASAACLPPQFQGARVCPRREDYTPDEQAAWLAWRDRYIGRSVVAASSIPAEGTSGRATCRACGTGTIAWARARINGHLHAACSTPGCFEMMQ